MPSKKPAKKRDRSKEYARDKARRRAARTKKAAKKAYGRGPVMNIVDAMNVERLVPRMEPVEAPARPADLVTAPPHYTVLDPQPIKVIEAWELPFHEGNAVKYIGRAPHKGDQVNDLKKAIQYLQWKVALLEKGDSPAA